MERDAAEDILFVEGVRTPHGVLLGSLTEVEAVELARIALDGLGGRVDLGDQTVDWVVLGNAIQAGIGQVPGRQAVIRSAWPDETHVTTINEASGSGVRAIALAADRIAAGRADVAIAGGFESMTNAPWILPGYRTGRRHGDVTAKDSMILDSLWDVNLDVHMGEITEGLVEREGITRSAQDEYAIGSHRRAAEAIDAGTFDDEIVPVETPDGPVERDEGPRPSSTMEDLASLRPAFRDNGTITAGNASKLSDGAGVTMLASAEAAATHDLEPVARLTDYAVSYRPPDEFNEAVGDVVEKVMAKNDLAVDDIDAYWVNEAFAAQEVYVMDRIGIPRDRMNPLGGAVAFGHPIGGSGGMIATSLLHQIRRGEVDRGLVGMSIGGGGAIMALVEQP